MERAKRYFGKVCQKHPELDGERLKSTRGCIKCDHERIRRRRAIPLNWAREVAQVRNRYRSDPTLRARQACRVRTAQHRIRHAAWQRNKLKADPCFAISRRLRARLYLALRGKNKSDRTLQLIGVSSIAFYKAYLEAQFVPGMTWKNAGTAWHIDHRIPLTTLDLSDPINQQFLFNYKNTRPMWAKANVSRGNKLQFEDLI